MANTSSKGYCLQNMPPYAQDQSLRAGSQIYTLKKTTCFVTYETTLAGST